MVGLLPVSGSSAVAGPVAATPGAAALRAADLWVKFKRGSAWIVQGYAQRGWTADKRGFDPMFERDIKVFEDDVQKPMDEAWKNLSEEERKDAELECARRGFRT